MTARPQDSPTPASVLEQVVAWWSEMLDVKTVRVDDDFFDLGGTSLVLVRFITSVQERFGVQLPLGELLIESFTPATTASAILGQIAELSGPARPR